MGGRDKVGLAPVLEMKARDRTAVVTEGQEKEPVLWCEREGRKGKAHLLREVSDEGGPWREKCETGDSTVWICLDSSVHLSFERAAYQPIL